MWLPNCCDVLLGDALVLGVERTMISITKWSSIFTATIPTPITPTITTRTTTIRTFHFCRALLERASVCIECCISTARIHSHSCAIFVTHARHDHHPHHHHPHNPWNGWEGCHGSCASGVRHRTRERSCSGTTSDQPAGACGEPVKISQNTFLDRTHCIAQL